MSIGFILCLRNKNRETANTIMAVIKMLIEIIKNKIWILGI